jgi:hypothetical protein
MRETAARAARVASCPSAEASSENQAPSELIRSCGVNPGWSDDAPRRFIRLGYPFVFSRVSQGELELLAIDASFKGDLFYGGICSLIIGNEPRIDQNPHKLYRKLPLHPVSPPVSVTQKIHQHQSKRPLQPRLTLGPKCS